ncbi:MAG: TVP38/TMEM64 family protein, partial [Gammaproteobacteria bacterium]
MNRKKALLVIVLVVLVFSVFAFDLGQFFNLEYFKSKQAVVDNYYQAQPVKTAFIFFCVYIAVTGLSLPGAALMTLIGGAIFGLLWGTVIVSFASPIGATVAFLVSRFLLRDVVQDRFRNQLKSVNEKIEKDGAFYLFALRLVPAFPFFIINLVMGLTPMRTLTFFIVSQAGMLAGTIVYVNAGTQIAKIETLVGILSPELIGSFVLLGIFPLIAKKAVEIMKARRVLRRYQKPKAFGRNIVVIGAGSAGLVAAYIAAAVKA